MNQERIEKNLKIIQEHMQAIIGECPEVQDACIVLNWDRAQIPDNTDIAIPASMVFSSRKTNSELHVQAVQLAKLLTDSALSMQERVINALLEANFEMSKVVAENDKAE